MDHGAFMKPVGSSALPSIATMLLRAAGTKTATRQAYWLTAKAKSVLATAEAFNVERRRRGLPEIVVEINAKGSPHVALTGMMLTDFFEFANEWDAAKNGRGPGGIKAGSGADVWAWRCERGHEWEARVSDRLIRLLRCGRCVTRRADETTSLAAKNPELLVSFDLEANKPLTPQTIRSTYPKTIQWRCVAGLRHPLFRASIAKRVKDTVPCPLCRKMRPLTAAKAARIQVPGN